MSTDNVDTKVVSLEFDNKQFEAGVKTSMSTLEKLKESLNFAKNTDSLQDLQKTVSNFDTSGLSEGVETVNAKWSAMQVIGTTALANLTNSAVNAGKKIFSALTSSITRGGWKRAMNIEQAKFQIEGLGHTWEEYADAIDYGVKDTAYGLDSAAKAASQFLASGITDANKMGGYLRAISGVAAMGGRDYDSVANIFTKIAGQGRVMGDELNQLASMGINAAATMAEQWGITETEVRDLVRKGKVSFADFADAMDDAFGQHAKDANKTFTGALSNMKAALARIGAKVATPLLKNLTDLFNWLRNAINQANKALDPFINGLNKLQDAVTDQLGVFITGSSRDRSFQHFKDQLNSTFGKDAQNVMKDFKAELKNVLGEDQYTWWIKNAGSFEKALQNGMADAEQISQAFANMADSEKYSTEEMRKQQESLRKMSIDAMHTGTALNRWFSDMEKTEKYTAYDKLSEAYHNAGLEYWRDVRPALIDAGNRRGVDVAKIIDDYGSIREAVKYGAIDVEIFKDAFNDLARDGSEDAKQLAKEISNSNSELGALIDRLGDRPSLYYIGEIFSNLVTMLGKPLKMIAEAFTEVFAGSFFDSLNDILKWVSDVTGELQLTDEFLEGVKSLVKGIFSIIKSAGGIIYRVLTIPMTIIRSLLRGVMSVFDAGSSLFGWFASGIGTVLQDIAAWIDSMTILETITNIIEDVFYKIGNTIGNVVNTIRESEAFQKVITTIKDAIWSVYSALKSIFFAINLDNVVDILITIVGAVADLVSWLLNLPVVQKAISVIASAFEKVAEFISKGAEALKKFFDSISTRFDFLSKFKEIGINMWQGLLEGFNFSAILDAIGGFFESLLQFICDILGIHSPSTEFYAIGQDMFNGLGWAWVETAKQWFPKMFDSLVAFFDSENLRKVLERVQYWAEQIIQVIAHIAQSALDALKKLDVGEAILGGSFILGARFLYKLPDVIREIVVPLHDFSSSLAKIGNAIATTVRKLGRVFDTLRDYIKSLKYGEYAEFVKAIAMLLAVLALAVFMMYKMVQNDPKSLAVAVGITAIIVGLLIGLIVAIGKIGKGATGVKDALVTLGAVSGFLVVLSGALLIYAMVLSKLRGFSGWDVATVYALLLPLFALVYVALLLVAVPDKAAITVASGMLKSMAGMVSALGAFLLMAAIAFKLFGGMPFANWVQALASIALIFAGLIALLFFLSKWHFKPADEAKALLKIGSIVSVVLALAATLALLTFIAHMDFWAALGGLVLLTGLVFALHLFEEFLLTYAKNSVGKPQARKIKNGLMQLIAPIAVLAAIVVLLTFVSHLGWGHAVTGLLMVVAFAGILWGFSHLLLKFDDSKLSGLRMLRVSKSLLTIAGAIGILAIVATLVSGISFLEACKGAANLIPFTILVLGMVWAMTLLAKSLKMNEPWMLRANYTLLYIVVAVGLLAGIALLISALDPQDFWKGIVIVGAMSAFMALLMFAFGHMAKYFVYESNLGKAYAALFIATLFIAALVGLLYLISESGVDGDLMVKAATAVSIMGLTIVAMLTVLMILGQKFMRLSGIDLKGVMALMEPLTALVGIIALLVLIAYMASYLPSGAAESILILSLALMALVPTALAISKMSSISGLNVANTFIMVGVLAALSVILALLVGVAALASLIPSSAVDTLERLASILLVMVVVAGVLTLLGFAAGAAVAGGLAFAAIAIIITVVGLILGLFAKLDAASGLITKGFDLLIMIAEKLGEAIGAFFYGMAAGMGNQDWSWLEKLQAALEPFMTFVSGFSAADVEGVQAMADVIEQISDIGYINSQTTKFGGTSGIDDFAESVPKLATALKSFNDSLGDGFDKALVSEAASSISALAESYVKISESTGSQDITKFTTNMPTLATALTDFADNVSEFKMTEGLQTSLDTLTNLSTTMPILTDIGNYKMNNFADSMTQLGTGLKNFAGEISKIEEGAENSPAVKLAQTLVELSQTLGGASGDDMGLGIVGSLANLLMGSDGDLGKFGKQCKDLGAGLAAYAEAASQIPDSFNENKGAVAVKLAQNLIELGKATGNANGLIMIPMLSTMMGNTDASDAVSRVKALGEVLVAFAGSLSDMPETLPSGLDKLVDVVKLMSMDWPEEIPNITPGESLSLKLFSSTLKTYAENLSGDALTILTDSGPALQSFAKGLGAISNVDSDKIANAINAVKAVNSKSVVESATNLVSSFGNAMSSASSGQSAGMAEAGTNMAKSMSDGFGKASSKYMKGAADDTVTSATSTFNSNLSKFTEAGTSAGQGFANGLRSTLPSTEAAASSLSSGAINKLKKLLDIKSPSRVLFGLGAYAGQGFVNGFISYKNAVDLAAQNMGNTLVDSVNDTLSAIGKDMSPVISPVMDLSNVSRGTAAISNMLDQAMTNSALGNIGGITNAMYRNSNRASNDDVVAAVDALRGDISNLATNSTTINGVTLDNSGEVADAIETLARYATLERRS